VEVWLLLPDKRKCRRHLNQHNLNRAVILYLQGILESFDQ
jgi:hypothetical protein